MEDDTVTVREAAVMLGTTKEKIRRLVTAGILESRASVLDARRRLIPRAQIEMLLIQEKHEPARRFNRAQLNRIVEQELALIPRGDVRQNIFRATYNAYRLHDLSVDPTIPASETFNRAVQLARRQQPDFTPEYDPALLTNQPHTETMSRAAGADPMVQEHD